MNCDFCGQPLPAEANYCPSCGVASGGDLPPPPSKPAGRVMFERTLPEGRCPACGSAEVYTDDQGLVISTGGLLAANLHDRWHGGQARVQTYLCAVCGYIELFLADGERVAEICQTWRRVGPPMPGA